MKIAIMQPYVFPHLGYFQMINAVETFVFYDDVNFIKQGWINRNRILASGKSLLFSIPVEQIDSFKLIKDTKISHTLFLKWKRKFLQTISQNYSKAPFFKPVNNLIIAIFEKENATIADLAIESLTAVSEYLDIKTKFKISSQDFKNTHLDRQERLFDICHRENANHYINSIGGRELYTVKDFAQESIRLDFIKTQPLNYCQFENEFVPHLSIIDVLMFNSISEIQKMLNKYELIQ